MHEFLKQGQVAVSIDELHHVKSLIEKIIYREQKCDNTLESNFLTVPELSVYTKYSKPSIYKYVRENKIPFIKRAGKLLFPKKEIDEWIAPT